PVVPAAVETADELIAPAAADDADVPEDAPADAADEPETPKLDAEEAAEPAEASEGADAPKEPIVEENTGKREAPGRIKAAEPAEDAEEVEESDEEAVEEPVRVEFVCDPADAVVTVYDPAEKDENGENAVIEPQSDGAYMLLPGEYLYDAECEGFERVEGVAFRVAAPEDGEALCFDVTLSPLPDRGTEKTRGIKASGVCGANGDNLTWTLSDSGELVISGTGPMADYSDEEGNLAPWKSNEPDKGDLWGITSVSIASGVTSIGNYAFFRSELTSVTIPGSVTSIGDYAIYCCPWLTSVTIPGSVTSIGNGAFFNCDSLTSVTIPSGVATIGELAFSACFSLSAIQVASDNANYCSVDGVLFSKDKTELLAFPAGKGTSYAIPAFVKSIGDFAFSSCINLESITIPTGVTSIGLEAFVDCVALTSVTIPGSVTSIGIASFVGCDALTSVTISQGVTSIGDDAFYVCNALTSVTIPGSVTSIGANAFAECASLTSVTFSQGVTSIGDWSFQRCPALTTVTIPDSVTSIGEGAFAHCPALASLTIPGSVTSIGSWAFQECHSLTGITIPKNLTSIGVGAFSWCQGLTAFSVASGNTAFTAADGVLFTKNKEALFCYPAGKSGSYTVPSGVSSISAYAFEGCSLLSSVTIPGSVRSIGEWCFEFCDSLNTIRFTGSAPAIDEGAFNSVTATAYYPAGDASWTAEVRQNYYGTITWKADSSVSALTAPVLTEAFNSATGVRVSWLAVGHAAKYQLLRKNLTKGETSWSVVGETTDLTLIDKSAVSASRYTFSVRAVDANGNIGPCDETGRTCTYIAKADITELKAVTNGVSITWSKPAGAKNFRVMRKKDGETKWNVIAVIEGTSYIDTTAKTGIKYWYTVRGVSMDNTVVINSYNGTGWSLNYAPAPTMTEAFNSSTGVRVSWKSVSNAAKYRLLRKNVTLG
ncbi:MAG: leucine-rich repeat protein, partial [Oscillospiraceae bacterium]|nr:leucine-rich repeat protein [Oscillospiraceae bacterium]